MKLATQTAEKDSNGKNTILVELNEDDVIFWNQVLDRFIEVGKFDKDDKKFLKILDNNKEQMHKARGIVRPS